MKKKKGEESEKGEKQRIKKRRKKKGLATFGQLFGNFWATLGNFWQLEGIKLKKKKEKKKETAELIEQWIRMIKLAGKNLR